ncbi:MAG: hypothetical protein Q8K32_24850 [Archangium sp.]|nr:hypothetical protein [Archangium sp.]
MRSHPDLPTEHLRLAQVVATAWLFTGQSVMWPAPTLLWTGALAVISSALCVAIVFSPYTRACCLCLASFIGLEIALNPTWFSHNRLFVAALLLMVSLSSRRVSVLPRWQVALVFLVAALDKLSSPAWRDGRFMASFIAELARFGLMWAPGGKTGTPNWLAQALNEAGTREVWMVVGLFAIAVELFLAGCFLFGTRFGAGLNVTFHVMVYAVTGSTMGQFFFAGVACSLLLVREEELPSAWVAVLATVALAGPWTHRFLPLGMLVVLWLVRRHHAHVSRVHRDQR